MKISELITKLEKIKETIGKDVILAEVKIKYPRFTEHWRMYSPTRRTKSGERTYINNKEYAKYVEDFKR